MVQSQGPPRTQAMLLMRGIVFLLAGLLLGGCMQSGTLAPLGDANFTARDKQQLANAPYRRAWISPAYQRQIVQYHRKEAPGSILVDTAGRYVFYVLPGGKAVRYGATVGEDGQNWSGVATVGRKEEWPTGLPPLRSRSGWTFPTSSGAARTIQWVRARYTFTPVARTRCTASTVPTSQNTSGRRFRRAASG